MTLFDRLFHRNGTKNMTAREAYRAAMEALREEGHRGAAAMRACCVYTSSEEAGDSVDEHGRSPAWHVDFCREDLACVYRVRVKGAKAKIKEERTRGRFPSAEYLYALYGLHEEVSVQANQLRPLPDSWIDSTNLLTTARRHLRAVFSDRRSGADLQEFVDRYEILTACLPALNLRYLDPEFQPRLLRQRSPDQLAWGLILAHENAEDEDAVALFMDAATGLPLQSETFRFPHLVMHGHSADW